MRRRPRLRHCAEYGLLLVAVAVLSALPARLALWAARRLGDFAFDVLRMRRRVTLGNLEQAYGAELTPPARRALARRTYRNIAMSFVELLRFAWRNPRHLADRAHLSEPQHIEAARALRRGVIYLTAHVGNWELCGSFISYYDAPLATIIADQRNPYVDRFVKRTRQRMGMEMIPIGSALRQVLRRLRAGGRVGIAAEQDAGPGGLFLPFFGRAASTAVGPARFAYRTGAPIVIAFDHRVGIEGHRIEVYPPLLPDPTRDETAEVARIMGIYAQRLEAFIRRHPDQWFWMHRRWKTRPPA